MPGFLSISFTQIKSYQNKSAKQLNLLAEEEILVNESNGELIDWKFIQNLHKLQEFEGLRAANKLRKAHIAFHKQKMKVKLAVQVFSASVANSLLFAQHQEITGFHNCDGTINFILMIDQMFDYLNTRNLEGLILSMTNILEIGKELLIGENPKMKFFLTNFLQNNRHKPLY
ncbi:unnamed protein product [Gordionus sp. m RMFG-2023]